MAKKTYYFLELPDGRWGPLCPTKYRAIKERREARKWYPAGKIRICTEEMTEREYKRLPEFDGY